MNVSEILENPGCILCTIHSDMYLKSPTFVTTHYTVLLVVYVPINADISLVLILV